MIRQGVTTQVTGNCGLTPAPVHDGIRTDLMRTLSGLEYGRPWPWNTFGQFLDAAARGAEGHARGPAGRARRHPRLRHGFRRSPPHARRAGIHAAPGCRGHGGGRLRHVVGPGLSAGAVLRHRGTGRPVSCRGTARRHLRLPHSWRGEPGGGLGARGPAHRARGGRAGGDLAPQSGGARELGQGADHVCHDRGGGPNPGRELRHLPVHSGKRQPEPARAALGSRGGGRGNAGSPSRFRAPAEDPKRRHPWHARLEQLLCDRLAGHPIGVRSQRAEPLDAGALGPCGRRAAGPGPGGSCPGPHRRGWEPDDHGELRHGRGRREFSPAPTGVHHRLGRLVHQPGRSDRGRPPAPAVVWSLRSGHSEVCPRGSAPVAGGKRSTR